MKKLLIALAGAACLFTQITAAKADQLQDIEKRGVIRIAVPQDFPPFGSVGTDLQPQGYDIDMALPCQSDEACCSWCRSPAPTGYLICKPIKLTW